MRFLLSILFLLTITGILPILIGAFILKHVILMILLGIVVFLMLAKELCN